MAKPWIIAVFVIFFIICFFATVNSLQCYECQDCPSVLNETYLVTCGETVTPDPPDNGNTTNPDIPNNGTITDPDNPSNGTNTNPDIPNNGTITDPDNPSNGTNTNPDIPNNGTITDPDNPSNGTNTNPDIPNNGTITDPDNPSNGTYTDLDNPYTGTSTDTSKNQKQVLRVRRSIELDIDANKACLCYGVSCPCDREGAVPLAVTYANSTWVCGSATIKHNGTEMKYKGCAPEKIENLEFCTYLKNASEVILPALGDNTTELMDCKTCNTDKCNGADDDDDNGATSLNFSVWVAMVTAVAILSVSS